MYNVSDVCITAYRISLKMYELLGIFVKSFSFRDNLCTLFSPEAHSNGDGLECFICFGQTFFSRNLGEVSALS